MSRLGNETPNYLSPEAASALYERIARYDKEIAMEMSTISNATRMIASAMQRLDASMEPRNKLATELGQKCAPDYEPRPQQAMGAAVTAYPGGRFYRQHPMPNTGQAADVYTPGKSSQSLYDNE